MESGTRRELRARSDFATIDLGLPLARKRQKTNDSR